MADDDFDLDAMLDSALDEGFAEPAAEEAGGGDDGEIDLDAMLDEAMVASVLDDAAEKSRASNDFGPSQQWLERKQGARGSGRTGGARGGLTFLRPERREAWNSAFVEDGRRQADMDKQRPLSRAYRSFYSAGKEEGGIVVHLGSGAAAAAAPATDGSGDGAPQGNGVRGGGVGGKASGPGDAEGGRGGAPDDVFEDVLSKGVSSSGVKEPPSVEESDYQTLDRLKASYLRLVAKDVRARVSKDPDLSTERFPGIASKILV